MQPTELASRSQRTDERPQHWPRPALVALILNIALPATSPPVDVARALFDALAKRDVDTALSLGTDDAVGDVVAIGEFRGKRSIREFVDELFSAFPTSTSWWTACSRQAGRELKRRSYGVSTL
jgi:SnoaL-like domain